ncbi:hypothetical protein [Egbenema bharatensis]|uniref:hypothetical protein n=1 Tax=Egbenema bharatensis TaxID=3463334 RepID=UPI003A8615C6
MFKANIIVTQEIKVVFQLHDGRSLLNPILSSLPQYSVWRDIPGHETRSQAILIRIRSALSIATPIAKLEMVC